VNIRRPHRGYTLPELLISVSIIVILLFAACGACVQTLRLEAAHAGRARMGRTAANLRERLHEEARSSTAVFIPATDLFGNANAGSGDSSEVDFFRRLSAGGDAYVAYRFDPAAGDVTRYEYTRNASGSQITHQDVAASGVAAFSAGRQSASGATVVGSSDLQQVSILYGRSDLIGGNGVVVVNMRSQDSGGVPGEAFSVHLASRAAPTSLAVLAPAGAGEATPPPSRVIPFFIFKHGFTEFHFPHGPRHGGNPGADGRGDGLHWVAAAGSAEFLGSGGFTGDGWFEFSSSFPSVISGQYSFRLSDGSFMTAVISCPGGPCPAFRPAPISSTIVPKNGVAFEALETASGKFGPGTLGP
jgi:prepilin-type N-terminal cleavage/methylation domain-containing protein